MHNRPPFLLVPVLAAACLGLPARPASSAPGDGRLVGRVSAGGLPLPGISVSVTIPVLAQPLSTISAADGRYQVASVPSGPCLLVFSTRGVELARAATRVNSSQTVRVDLNLDEAARGEGVAVVEDAALDEGSASWSGTGGEWLEHAPAGPDGRSVLLAVPGFFAGAPGADGAAQTQEPSDAPWPQRSVVAGVVSRRGTSDASTRSPGVVIDVVAKPAAGRFGGSARHEWANRVSEAAIDAGGPANGGRTRMWGALSRVKTEKAVPGLDQADATTTWTGDARLQHEWGTRGRSEAAWTLPRRGRPTRDLSVYDRVEATTKQRSVGIARPLRVRQLWSGGRALSLEGSYAFSDASFALDFQDPALADVQAAYDRFTLVRSRSATSTRSVRRTHEAEASGDWLVPVLGHSHALRFGGSLTRMFEEDRTRTGGGAVAVFDSHGGLRTSYQARILRDGVASVQEVRASVYVSDEIVLGSARLTLGTRFDLSDDHAPAAVVPASRLLPDLLPAVRFAGADSGVRFADWSPRVGVAWNPGGNGITVVRAAAGRYHGENNRTSGVLQPTQQTRLTYWWRDDDGDAFVRREELDLARGLAAAPSANYDPAAPGAPRTPATVDPRLRSRREDEISAGVERRLAPRVALRLDYAGRKISRLSDSFAIEADGTPVSSASYSAAQWTPAFCPPGALCPAISYYQRAEPLPAGTMLRNTGEYEWRQSVTLALHRRQAGGWMLDGSVEWNGARRYLPKPTRDYTDPTNVAFRNGTEYSTPLSHWIARVAGTVRLPGRLVVAALVEARQGLPFDRVISSPERQGLGSTNVSIARYGSVRHPASCRVDLRIDRAWIAGHLRIAPVLDVANLLNRRVVVARNRVQNSLTANAVTGLEDPRTVRLGLRATW